MTRIRLESLILLLLLTPLGAHSAAEDGRLPLVLAQTSASQAPDARGAALTPDQKKELEIGLTELKLKHLKGEISDAEFERKRKELTSQFESSASQKRDFEIGMTELKLQHMKGEISDAEYMQRQRELVNDYSKGIREKLGVAPAAASSGDPGAGAARYRVAVFPMRQIIPRSPHGTDALLYRYAHDYIGARDDMELVFSEYDPSFEPGGVGTVGEIWSDSFTDPSPNVDRVRTRATQIGANVAVLISHKKRGAGWYGNEFEVKVRVFELDSGETHLTEGSELNFENAIESAFRRMSTN